MAHGKRHLVAKLADFVARRELIFTLRRCVVRGAMNHAKGSLIGYPLTTKLSNCKEGRLHDEKGDRLHPKQQAPAFARAREGSLRSPPSHRTPPCHARRQTHAPFDSQSEG